MQQSKYNDLWGKYGYIKPKNYGGVRIKVNPPRFRCVSPFM